MFLVDTKILSAAAPTAAPGALASWLGHNGDRLYLSTMTVAEIEGGIAKARRTGAHAKAARLADWLDTVLHLYSPRIIPLDLAVARALGQLSDLARSIGAAPGFADLAIAATAITRGYTVLTRNTRHFRDIPVAVHDPFAALPTPA